MNEFVEPTNDILSQIFLQPADMEPSLNFKTCGKSSTHTQSFSSVKSSFTSGCL